MKHLRTAAVVLSACMAIPAGAQFRKPEEAIKYRQAVMYTMGNHLYGRLGAMVNGRVPFDAKVAADNAELVATLSRLPWMAFQPGTEKGETDAKPAVWTEQAKFRDLSEKAQLEATKLAAAARTGDIELLKTAYRTTTSSCKSCHDSFTSQ